LAQLCEELRGRKTLEEGDPLNEFAFYRPRALLIYALLGIYWMWSEADGWEHTDHKDLIKNLIPEQLPPCIWGEAAVPQFLAYTWYRKRISPSSAHDEQVAVVLREIMSNKLNEDADHLASPYYDIEKVTRHSYAKKVGWDDPFGGESFAGSSYVCESLLMCVVRAGMKEICQALWPAFTHMTHLKTIPDDSWRYALYRMGDHAMDDMKIYPGKMLWSDLQEIAAEHAGTDVPPQLRKDQFLLLLFVIIFPFRASFSAVKFLHKRFDTASHLS
jgi:hypothetical protein